MLKFLFENVASGDSVAGTDHLVCRRGGNWVGRSGNLAALATSSDWR